MKKNVVSIFKQKVLEIIKSRGVKFIIFGSRGRGDADEFSDYDLLIITPGKEYDVKEELKELSLEPFIMNALKEGVSV